MPSMVYYDMSDAAGVMYHAEYIQLMARARTEALKTVGFDIAGLAQLGVIFVVKNVAINYKKAIPFGVEVVVESDVSWPSRVRMLWRQRIVSAKVGVGATAEIEVVCVNAQFKPMPVPDEIFHAIQ